MLRHVAKGLQSYVIEWGGGGVKNSLKIFLIGEGKSATCDKMCLKNFVLMISILPLRQSYIVCELVNDQFKNCRTVFFSLNETVETI